MAVSTSLWRVTRTPLAFINAYLPLFSFSQPLWRAELYNFIRNLSMRSVIKQSRWLLVLAFVFFTGQVFAHGMSEAEKMSIIDGGNLR